MKVEVNKGLLLNLISTLNSDNVVIIPFIGKIVVQSKNNNGMIFMQNTIACFCEKEESSSCKVDRIKLINALTLCSNGTVFISTHNDVLSVTDEIDSVNIDIPLLNNDAIECYQPKEKLFSIKSNKINTLSKSNCDRVFRFGKYKDIADRVLIDIKDGKGFMFSFLGNNLRLFDITCCTDEYRFVLDKVCLRYVLRFINKDCDITFHYDKYNNNVILNCSNYNFFAVVKADEDHFPKRGVIIDITKKCNNHICLDVNKNLLLENVKFILSGFKNKANSVIKISFNDNMLKLTSLDNVRSKFMLVDNDCLKQFGEGYEVLANCNDLYKLLKASYSYTKIYLPCKKGYIFIDGGDYMYLLSVVK